MNLNSITKREIQDFIGLATDQTFANAGTLNIIKHNISGYSYVSRNITTAYGGEDGRVTFAFS